MSEPKQMQWQLVGSDGGVIVLTVPSDPPVSVAISDKAFVEAVNVLATQARNYPHSMLRRITVEGER